MKKIPFVDLQRQYKEIQNGIDKAIKDVLETSQFILGSQLEKFEGGFAKFCGVKYAVGMGSGLTALELGMRALGVGVGDEVITPVNSFIASSSAISFTGATPIFVDCLEDTFNIDIKKAEKLITKRTKAIMPVHLYGQLANMEEVMRFAKKYKLFVIEDACQAHGASFKDRKSGSFGHVTAFSFYPGKNLGAYGDGGALVTNSAKIAEVVRTMRNYGQKEKYNHIFLAWNSRLDTIQAAILRIKLKHLDKWNKGRLEYAKLYNSLLKNLPIILPKIFPNYTHVFHLYVIRVKEREKLSKYLKEKGIATGIHYPIPIHLQKAYKNLGYKKGDFTVAEKLADEILSLPMYPELKKAEVKYICKQIASFYNV